MKTTLKLTWIETKLFLREPLAVIFAFAFPFFVLFVLGGVFGSETPDNEEDMRIWRGVSPTRYYLPAYVGLVMASVGLISLPLRLAAYREQGVLRRYHAAGMSLGAVLASQAVVAIAMSLVGAVAISIASMTVYDSRLPESWAATLFAFALSGVAFAAIGLLLGGLLPTARAAQGAGLILFFVMMFISGAGPPREVLSTPMQNFSEILPLSHVIVSLQDAWLGYGWAWGANAIVAAFLVVALGITLWRFRWE
jgi:ABC-2 type transport system permease protein